MDKRAFDLISKLVAIKDELQTFIVEKEELLELVLVAVLAKKNLFILGKPGESKSYAINQFAKRVQGSKYFETLMHKLMNVSEIFGQLDVTALEKGQIDVLTSNTATEANINFLDELFKSSDACLNTTLKLLNFENIQVQGKQFEPPTLCTFAASNEIPNFQDEVNDVLRPLYDRLHLKITTSAIKNPSNYEKALKAKREELDKNILNTIDLSELKELQEFAKKIEVTKEADETFWEICNALKENLKLHVSDRKKIEYSSIVQAHALLNNREKVDVEKDFPILKYYLWEQESQINQIEKIISEYIENPLNKMIKTFESIILNLKEEFIKNIEELEDERTVKKYHRKFTDELANTYNQLSQLTISSKQNDDSKRQVNELLNLIERINRDIITDYIEKFGVRYVSIEAIASRMI